MASEPGFIGCRAITGYDALQLTMKTNRNGGFPGLTTLISEYFGLSKALSLLVVCFIVLVTGFAIFWFIHSAPPRVITITSGPPGSPFATNALKYAAILSSNGVTLNILPSQGSLENLQRLQN